MAVLCDPPVTSPGFYCSAATSDTKLEDHEVSGAAPPFSIIGGGWRVVTADPSLRASGFMKLRRSFEAQYGGAQRRRRRVVLRRVRKRRKVGKP